MCRKKIEGDWQEQSFSVVNQGDHGNAARQEVVNFVNKKTLFLRLR